MVLRELHQPRLDIRGHSRRPVQPAEYRFTRAPQLLREVHLRPADGGKAFERGHGEVSVSGGKAIPFSARSRLAACVDSLSGCPLAIIKSRSVDDKTGVVIS